MQECQTISVNYFNQNYFNRLESGAILQGPDLTWLM